MSTNLRAQNIVGVWEGVMHGVNGTFIQINIDQRGSDLCGFSHDYLKTNVKSFCKAKFIGKFSNAEQQGVIIGQTFLSNSGGHVLMKIKLWREKSDNKNTLRAMLMQDGLMSILFGSSNEDANFILKRVASKPNNLDALNCFPKTVAAKPKVIEKPKVTNLPPTQKPGKTTPTVTNNMPVPVIKDSITIEKKVVTIPKPSNADKALMDQMKNRKQNEQGRVKINTDKLNLKIYDNGYVDQDTISVFYNGRLLVSKQGLSEKAIEINLDLDMQAPYHEIVLFADNLGSIPPNTALIVVTAGGKRFELRSKANLQENAVLVFEVEKPDK